jgi:hypothetical protein
MLQTPSLLLLYLHMAIISKARDGHRAAGAGHPELDLHVAHTQVFPKEAHRPGFVLRNHSWARGIIRRSGSGFRVVAGYEVEANSAHFVAWVRNLQSTTQAKRQRVAGKTWGIQHVWVM